MKDMAYSEAEKKDMRTSIVGGGHGDAPKYPYGLQIRLEPEQVRMLELADPKVDGKVTLIAEAVIDSVSAERNQDDSKGYSVSLQITKMDVKQSKQEETATALYGEY